MTDSPVKELWADYRFSCPICGYVTKSSSQDIVTQRAEDHIHEDHSKAALTAFVLAHSPIDAIFPEPEPEPEPFTL